MWARFFIVEKAYLEKGTILKDYLIRIHRREKNDPRILVGVVEEVGVEGNKVFSNLDELWEILNPSKPETSETKKRNKFYVMGIHPRKRKNKPKNLLAPERGRGLR
jgi:hypothetical protein